jgi:4-carboxymuconolactone decarboxylase
MTDEPLSETERRDRGVSQYHEVYGDDAFILPEGQSDFFDLMMKQLFGEVWSRPALSIESRRLLVMGVLAAQQRFDVLGIQLTRCLDTGELNPEQVREVAIQLIPYVGYPSSGDLFRVTEAAIANAAKGAS